MSLNREVLIVEDDDGTRSLFGALVQHYGFQPRYAADGGAALMVLQDKFAGVVLLDLLLPIRDGLSIIRELKRTNPQMLKRTIVVTAAPERLLGACDELCETWKLFRKPIDVEELAAVLLDCASASEKAKAGHQH